ncbi:MAG: tetratricopeptide repeat protein [Spirochaetales bacterium]|nr:tetratricopeptide repeat protein [Spirochaetales bacterium]
MFVYKINTKRLLRLLFLVLLLACIPVYGNDGSNTGKGEATGTGLTPRFPESDTNLVLVEGEDAVSTNFNKEPILNYGCSGKRTLQLNRVKGLQGDAPFYADFVFFIEAPGTYEFWYGGTPAGTEDDIFPSYVSPFDLFIDEMEEPWQITREHMTVVENYTPVYYWNMVRDLTLSAGKHKIRFEVKEKRRYDGRYYFYLDSFFLVRKEGTRRMIPATLPEVFPENMDDRSIDRPFRAIDDYLVIIRDNPDDTAPLVEISLIYSLLSDYLNAIKYLKRALVLEPDSIDIRLLIAKNYIWKGDTETGLRFYQEVLDQDPSHLSLWLEAGKIAAWTGRLSESEELYKRALELFPGNLDLFVNLGLTYLWSGSVRDAEKMFDRAFEGTEGDLVRIKELAGVYIVNNYPDRAAAVYEEAIRISPEDIELYILLWRTYDRMGEMDAALKVRRRIETTFLPSEKLNEYCELQAETIMMKEAVMEDYRARLAEQPDNLELRETLAQAYFWNGFRRKAIDEYLNILVNHLYRFLESEERESFDLLYTIDRLYVLESYFSGAGEIFRQTIKQMFAAMDALEDAEKEYGAYLKKKEEASASGEAFREPSEDPSLAVTRSKAACSSLVGDARRLLIQYKAAVEELEKCGVSAFPLEEKDREEEKVFEQITEPLEWQWRRDETIAELRVVEAGGLYLAGHVIAKIDQIENRLGEAAARYEVIGELRDYPERAFAQAQVNLWNGDVEAAMERIASPGSRIREYAPYTAELLGLMQNLARGAAGGIGAAEDYSADLCKAVKDDLETLSGDIAKRAGEVEKRLGTLKAVYRRTVIRTIYRYEESTYLLRNELGDFYLEEKELANAIRQYRKVLAIDPWDISAQYRIGTVYQWNKQWSKAMAQYREVYWADPNYEQATARYNTLAREHADSIHTRASYEVDTSRIIWKGQADYTTEINENLGLIMSYAFDYYRVFRWAVYGNIKEEPVSPPDMKHYSYQVHDLLLGLSLVNVPLGVSLTLAGGCAVETNNELANQEEESFADYGGDNITLFDFIGFNNAWPYGELEFRYEVSPEFSLDIQSRAGIYPETYGYGYTTLVGTDDGGSYLPILYNYNKRKVIDISGSCNMSSSFSFIDAPVINGMGARGYGEIDYLIDDHLEDGYNFIYLGLGELSVRLFEIEDPYTTLGCYGSFTYQSSTIGSTKDDQAMIDYYSPHDVIIAGGGITFSHYAGLDEDFVLGVSLNYGAFFTSQFEVSEQDVVERLKIQLETTIEVTKGDGVFYLTPVFVNLMNYETGRWWEYWNFIIRLGFLARLPRLLAQ